MTRREVVVVTAVLLVPGIALAASGPGREGKDVRDGSWGPGSAYGRMFDPETMETVRGEVTAVDLVNPRKGMSCGVCLTLRTQEGPLTVHLGPARYVSRQETTVQLHDQVEVSGSRVAFKGETIIMAVSVRKGNDTLVLRDGRGVPAWSGGRRDGPRR